MKLQLSRIPGPLLLIIITVLVCLANYSPKTYLTGWDTLHPEFNFRIYLSRVIFSVWQEHQALGAVASQAHAAELPRLLILLVLNLFMSTQILRYAYMFLMLIIGPLGIYFFLYKVLLKDFNITHRVFGSFIGGLYYLFNLGTLQHFYVPLEMFVTHYGWLGWLFLAISLYYENTTRRNLSYFLLVSFFIIPQAHTPTLFYAYYLAMFIYLCTLLMFDFINKETADKITVRLKPAFVIMVSTLMINSFWLLPNVYFALTHGVEIGQSKIHHLFSQEAFLQNQQFGTLEDTAILRNFLFNWGEYKGSGNFGDLMDEWKLHLSHKYVLYLGYAYFSFVVIGVLIALMKRNKFGLSLFSVAFLGIFFLLNNNPPFGFIFSALQEKSALFKEAFRFPFTKFSMYVMFAYASYLAFALAWFGDFVAKHFRKWLYKVYLAGFLTLVVSLFIYAKPMLYGYLISPSMRVSIPQRYFDMFAYLDKQEEYGRVANLPIHTFWGWVYHNWIPSSQSGYQGAGFLWFGIKQPLMDREFDRWDIINEQYYREMSTAIYSQDLAMVERTLLKYKVKWILYDKSVLAPGADSKSLYIEEINSMLSGSDKFELAKDFGQGLLVYKFLPADVFKRTGTWHSFTEVSDSLFKEYDDYIYAEHGNYVNIGQNAYPFLGITDYTEKLNSNYVVADDHFIKIQGKFASRALVSKNNTVEYEGSLISDGSKVLMQLNSGQVINLGIPVNPTAKYLLTIKDAAPIYIDPNALDSTKFYFFKDPQEDLLVTVHTLVPSQVDLTLNVKDRIEKCSSVEGGSVFGITYLDRGFKLSAKDIVSCATLKIADYASLVSSKSPYLVLNYSAITQKAQAGICMFDPSSGLCFNQTAQNSHVEVGKVPGNIADVYLRFLANNLNSLGNYLGTVTFANLELYTSGASKTISANLSDSNILPKSEFELRKDPKTSTKVINLPSNPRICSNDSREFDRSSVTVMEDYYRYASYGDSLCDSFQFPNAPHSSGYILEVKARNIQGMPLRICMTNEYSKRCDVYFSLEESANFDSAFYLLPPMGNGSGYTLNISNLVFGDGISINDLQYISLTPVPYMYMRTAHTPLAKNSHDKVFVLYEAFERGWVLFCGLKPCDAKHVMVNNWANGWIFEGGQIPDNVRVYFWPQVLQYVGFVLLVSLVFFYARHKDL
jgi:hypothetical protein